LDTLDSIEISDVSYETSIVSRLCVWVLGYISLIRDVTFFGIKVVGLR